MGFGHRVYKSYDPRAKIIKRMADQVFDVTGRNPLLEMALELERIALEDEYFVSRKLYPNVDFYSGLIYQAMGFPVDMFPVLFAIPRTAGWIAQWEEMLNDPEQKIARPRQIYLGREPRDYVRQGQAAVSSAGHGHPVHNDADTDLVGFVVFVACVIAGRGTLQRAGAAGAAASKFDGDRAFEDLRQQVAIGPRPAGSAALEQTRDYIKKQLTAAGLTVDEQAFDAHDAARRGRAWSTCARRCPGTTRARPHRHRRPLRHEADHGIPLRRRQRRRVERGVPARDRARAQGARQPAADRARCSSTARKRSSTGTCPTPRTTPTAAATTSSS